ncbi:hypothetical protein QF035_010726 [Streptomyces umbrinus]|uniref:Uncharacterized protein n=1 Tax=Streptomyces umbrinus TaxID=67370 RepID=A0ABU0TEB1_9ACTN|nr:hypothetical protein [Streptomyces umbrinus]MDQ1033144.1 hypothetical protein [Streptomyces umbrinus]
MALNQQEAASAEPVTNRRISAGVRLMGWLTTTDHKVIGNLYMVTAFGFFLLGGVMAMVMRAELARPGMQVVSAEQYNQLLKDEYEQMCEQAEALSQDAVSDRAQWQEHQALLLKRLARTEEALAQAVHDTEGARRELEDERRSARIA